MYTIEYYRHELYRIAWRMQYRTKRDFKREVPIVAGPELMEPSFSEQSENKIVMQQYINELTSELGKRVIHEIYVNDKTETQVARELQISQQAVSKWKKKMIGELYQKMNF
ncbi:sigma-70 family RNA polymerase sigma factor [Paenibacillus tengchongensis]|uniref:sigma-70 family RNA polymerase sigma factor n=1 Tax=Paenibacillus tengchongensis TaxID=2608684 RepID=UPI00124E5D6C|nr:sigma-70 family RNA polymerase sigma factor [Paenibacillus tengchongensis]